MNLKQLTRLMLVATAICLLPTAVSLATTDNPVTVPENATGTLFVISAWIVTLVVGSIVPVATALVTRLGDSSFLKYALTVLINGVVAFLTTGLLEDGTKLVSGQTFMTWVFGVVLSLVTYPGWKAAGITSSTYKPTGSDVAVPGLLATRGLRK